jgi:DNA (cytosine-5)-methyltransferase 1
VATRENNEAMKVIKVLNNYAGIGGNRKYWKNVKVTAVENDPEIAAIYQANFPDDIVIVGDAHQYLLDHYSEFDFIWSSFPCTTHTRMNVNFHRVRYADLGLFQEIILLNTFFEGKFCVENVIPYYDFILKGVPVQQFNRHYFWANFKIRTTGKGNPPKQIQNIIAQNTRKKRPKGGYYHRGEIVEIKVSQPHFGFDLSGVTIQTRKDKILRNCVDPEIGLDILNCARGLITRNKNNKQQQLFNF